MIRNHDIKKRITVSGETADLYLSISAVGINTKDATMAEVAFDQFLGMINGSQIKRHHTSGTVSNFNNGPWSPEEKHAILTVPEDEAWANYQKHFPNSSRTKHAVRRLRTHLLEKGAIVKHIAPDPTCIEETGCLGCKEPLPSDACDKCSPPLIGKEAVPVVERKTYRGVGNQYGIPSSLLKTDKKLYNRLDARCRSQGINYDEALAQEGVMKQGQRKPPVKKERLPFHQTHAGGTASSGTNSQVITSGTPATPATYPTSPASFGLHLKTGDKVRHNGSKASPFFGQVGEIQKLSADGQCYVKFGESLTWLSPYSVVVVPGASAS